MIVRRQTGLWAFHMHHKQTYYAFVTQLKQYCEAATDTSESIQLLNYQVLFRLMAKLCDIDFGLRQYLLSDPSKHGPGMLPDLLAFIMEQYGEQKESQFTMNQKTSQKREPIQTLTIPMPKDSSSTLLTVPYHLD